jgi:predicted ester cyclase
MRTIFQLAASWKNLVKPYNPGLSFLIKGEKIMSEVEIKNKVLVARIYEEMWNQRKLSVANEIFAQPESVQRFLGEFLNAFPDLQHKVEELIAEGDRVVARFSAQGTHTGQWKDFAPSGNLIHYSGITLVRIVGNKIVEHHTWWDRLEVIDQIKGKAK